MIGTLRIQAGGEEFNVVEPRGEGKKWDLRIRETGESEGGGGGEGGVDCFM
jgi:hypothetical protein